MQLLRKISARTVFGSKADIQTLVLADRTKPHPLFRVIGICNGTRHGTSKDRDEETAGPNAGQTIISPGAKGDGKSKDWTALLGNFQATKLSTGEIFRSGVCFLPNYVTDSITGQLGVDVEAVRFGFDISARFDGESATSYVFEAQNLMPAKPDDALNNIASEIAGALTGPKSEPAPAADAGKPIDAKKAKG
jgi:hypothetical protein